MRVNLSSAAIEESKTLRMKLPVKRYLTLARQESKVAVHRFTQFASSWSDVMILAPVAPVLPASQPLKHAFDAPWHAQI